MTHEQKQQIEAAIYNLKAAVEHNTTFPSKAAFDKVSEAQNALYDAIGGMDDYKFDIQ
ncbi:MAG: hypothetical protein IKA32_04775 [Lentisphaeria bacterium]|nr:hypothetical protein [Lentisphaeria bacterium]